MKVVEGGITYNKLSKQLKDVIEVDDIGGGGRKYHGTCII